MKDTFQRQKKDTLLKSDKSSKGCWDKKIQKLCEKINSLENYYTTSSCSGRIVLIIDTGKKQKDLFLKIYHDLISFKELKEDLKKIKNKKIIKFKQKLDKKSLIDSSFIKFKSEPCILHVACVDLESARKLYDKAKLAGWKKSGIIASGKRFIVELNSTEKLEFPIIRKGKILVSDEFLKLIVKKANENLKKSWAKIERLKKSI